MAEGKRWTDVTRFRRIRSAYEGYGKGVGSPGVLSFGDCLAYGVAMAVGVPLLYKGEDFSQTDVIGVD